MHIRAILMIVISVFCFMLLSVSGQDDNINHVAILVVDVFEESPLTDDDLQTAFNLCNLYDECYESIYEKIAELQITEKKELLESIQGDIASCTNTDCKKTVLIDSGIVDEVCSDDGNDSETCINPNETCVVAIGGQDGGKIRGGEGEVFLSSALRPGAAHGELLHSDLSHLVRSQFALTPITPTLLMADVQIDPTDPQSNWVRQIETWKVNTGDEHYISLIGIDTNGYDQTLIGSRIDTVIDILASDDNDNFLPYPVDSFVINMSFSFVPCDRLPALDMLDYIYTWIMMDTSETGVSSESDEPNQYRALLEEFLGDYGELDPAGADWIIEIFDEYQDYIETGTVEPFYASFKREKEDNERLQDHSLSFFAVIADPQYSLIRNDVMLTLTIPRLSVSFANTFNVYNTEETGEKSTEELEFLDVFPISGTYSDEVLLVASAGNDGLSEPYFPASSPEVLSVSAEYSDLNDSRCDSKSTPEKLMHLMTLLEDAIFSDLESININLPQSDKDAIVAAVLASIESPMSNKGEVQHNGVSALHQDDVLGCLRGTSFAAPRIALETAVFLLQKVDVNEMTPNNCEQPPGSDFDHPLSYDGFADLTREIIALVKGCAAFQMIPDVP